MNRLNSYERFAGPFGDPKKITAKLECANRRGWKNLMIGHENHSYRRVAAKASASLFVLLFLLGFTGRGNAQATPAYVVSSRVLLTTNVAGAAGNYAVNSRGDFFLQDGGSIYNSGFKVQHLLEFPASGGGPITLFTDSNANGPNGVAVDPFDNLFLTEDQGPNGNNDVDSGLYQFPSTNQTYPGPYVYNSNVPPGSCNPYIPAVAATATVAGSAAIPANTGVCALGLFQGTAYYYWQPFNIAADGQGYIYFYANYDNTYGSTAKGIYACDPQCVQQGIGGQGTQLTPKPGDPGAVANTITSMAADYAGDVFYADLNNVWELPVAGRAALNYSHETSVVFDGTYTKPFGVQFDASGNMYVTDANGIWEVLSVEADGSTPCKGGTDVCSLVPASKFKLIPLPGLEPTYSAPCYTNNLYAGVAVDNKGDIVYSYSCANYDQRNVYKSSLWAGTLPSVEVGSTSATPLTFTVQFDQATTVASIAAMQGSAASAEFTLTPGTCVVGTAFAADSSCTFTVNFSPSAVGTRNGAIIITDSTGKSTTTNLTGIGLGTAVTIDPGTPSKINGTFQTSTGIAVDSSANVYVADSKANTVTEYPAGGGTPVSIGTGLNVPTGVAVDGGGNVYIVNQGTGDVITGTPPNTTATGTGSVVEVPLIAGKFSSAAQSTLVSALRSPTDIVVDGAGNLYVSATGSNEVLQFSSAIRSSQSAAGVPRGYGFSAPTGLAVDPSGNIYVADTGNDRVLKLGDGTQNTVGNGLSAPIGVAVDPSGSVIIVDGSGRLIRVPNETGQGAVGLNQADQQVLNTPLSYPYSVRLDGAGNIYVSDNVANAVYEIQRSAGTIDFGDWNVNTISDPQIVVVANAGTDPLTLTNPIYAPVPASTGFTVTQGTSSQACGAGAFNSGFNCQLVATFAPTANGPVTYDLALAAPNVQNPAPSVTLKGNGVMLDPATLAVSQVLPVGPISYGQTIEFSATITPTGSTALPTGGAAANEFVVFSFDGQDYRGSPVTNGVATFTFPLVNAGTHSISAHYLGDANYPELQSPTVSVNIALAPSTNTLVIVGDSATPLSAADTSTVTMTDTIVPSEPGLLQGTVSFYNIATNPATLLGTYTLGAPDPTTHNYVATFSFTASNGLRNGNYTIDAVFSGNSNYSMNTSEPLDLVITDPSFTVTLDKTSVTSSANNPGVINVTVTDFSNFQAGVSFSCAPASSTPTPAGSLPVVPAGYIINQFAANAFCVFRPISAQLTSAPNIMPNTIYPVAMSLQMQVDQDPLVVEGSFGWAGGLLAIVLVLVWKRAMPKRGLRVVSLVAVLALSAVAALTGCGSSGSNFKTPPGTYNLVISAIATQLTTSGTIPTNPVDVVQTFNVTVTVK